ncbi:hypothetical protein PENSPDRAFT_322338 [Peniophora sp. CONT]|nr:hypothetical protein PENSPDRAFT_322338 [Peniophora sp. CONT]
MITQPANSFWSTKFEHRSEELSEDIDVLSAEIEDVEYASKVFLSALRARVDNLRVKKAQSRATTALSLPVEIFLHMCSFLANIDPLGELCEYDDCVSNIETHGADDASSTCSTEFDGADDDSYFDSETGDIRLSYGLGWSRVTHVCAQWRNRALRNSTLWTTIPLNLCMPWLQELIKRTNNVPLDIILPCDSDEAVARQVLEECIHRVRSITTECSADVIESILLSHRAPLLEQLEVNLDCGRSVTLPANMAEALPRLRMISLASVVDLPKLPQSAVPSQITRLVILSAASIPSQKDMSGMIRSLTHVQYLHLEDCLPDVGFWDEPQELFSLSHLETLILRGPMSTCGAMIQAIEPPPCASVTLYLLPEHLRPEDENQSHVSQYMRRSGLEWLYNTIGTTAYHSLRISCTKEENWQLVVTALRDRECPACLERYDPDVGRQRNKWSGPSQADLKVVCLFPLDPLDGGGSVRTTALPLGVFKRTLTDLPLASVSVLSLSVDTFLPDIESWDYLSWLPILANASGVKHLQLISAIISGMDVSIPYKPSDCYVELFIALSLVADDGRVNRLMPHLETLSLIDIDADAKVDIKEEDEILTVTATEALHRVLASRGLGEGAVDVEYTSPT